MPWIGCELWAAELGPDGAIGRKRLVCGGDDESVFQPEWSPDGRLYLVSDRARPLLAERWWNLFRIDGDALDEAAPLRPVYPMAAEFGRAQWQFRMSTYAFTSAGRLVCSYGQSGSHRLATVDLASLEVSQIATQYEDVSSVRASAGQVYFRGGAPISPPEIVELDLTSGHAKPLRLSTSQDMETYRGYLSVPEPVTFDSVLQLTTKTFVLQDE